MCRSERRRHSEFEMNEDIVSVDVVEDLVVVATSRCVQVYCDKDILVRCESEEGVLRATATRLAALHDNARGAVAVATERGTVAAWTFKNEFLFKHESKIEATSAFLWMSGEANAVAVFDDAFLWRFDRLGSSESLDAGSLVRDARYIEKKGWTACLTGESNLLVWEAAQGERRSMRKPLFSVSLREASPIKFVTMQEDWSAFVACRDALIAIRCDEERLETFYLDVETTQDDRLRGQRGALLCSTENEELVINDYNNRCSYAIHEIAQDDLSMMSASCVAAAAASDSSTHSFLFAGVRKAEPKILLTMMTTAS